MVRSRRLVSLNLDDCRVCGRHRAEHLCCRHTYTRVQNTMVKLSIERTEHTWNPTTDSTKASPGSKHCYAEVIARQLAAMGRAGDE